MKRLDILKAMRSRFATISKASGYNYTVSKCGLFDVVPVAKSTNLFVSVFDRGQTRLEVNYGAGAPEDLELDVDVICRMRVTKTTQEDDYTAAVSRMVEDIRRSVGTDDTWGGLAFKTDYVQDTADIQAAQEIIVQATISLKVQFRVNQWSN